MTDKSKEIFIEISRLAPGIDLMSIKRKRGGKLYLVSVMEERMVGKLDF